MTAATIVGLAAAEGDVSSQYHRTGRLASARSFDTLITQLPGPVAVDVEHDGEQIGDLVYAELDAGRLGCVCVVEDGQWLLDFPGDVHYSPELLTYGDGVRSRSVSIADTAGLVSLSLTTTPATVASQPITVLAGDVRRSSAWSGWPMSWRSTSPLLARCVDHLPSSSVDRERHRARSIRKERVYTRLADNAGFLDEDGELIPAGRTHGGLHIRPCGPIISVR